MNRKLIKIMNRRLFSGFLLFVVVFALLTTCSGESKSSEDEVILKGLQDALKSSKILDEFFKDQGIVDDGHGNRYAISFNAAQGGTVLHYLKIAIHGTGKVIFEENLEQPIPVSKAGELYTAVIHGCSTPTTSPNGDPSFAIDLVFDFSVNGLKNRWEYFNQNRLYCNHPPVAYGFDDLIYTEGGKRVGSP